MSFIVMIDDLKANCEVHKFVDDTTLSELITKHDRNVCVRMSILSRSH